MENMYNYILQIQELSLFLCSVPYRYRYCVENKCLVAFAVNKNKYYHMASIIFRII